LTLLTYFGYNMLRHYCVQAEQQSWLFFAADLMLTYTKFNRCRLSVHACE